MKLCLFGGAFDPVHEGHVQMASQVHGQCGLDKVLFMPCGVSPHKTSGPIASDEQRCEMLCLALKGLDWAVLDRTDLEMPKPSWSWRLAELMSQRYPHDELYWLMGKDQWDALEKWGRWQYLAELVTFIVYHRHGVPQARPGVRAMFIEGNEPASSSAVRAAISSGHGHIPFLNAEVKKYIAEKKLYRPQ